MTNITKYLITATIQGVLVGLVQYIFEEIDPVIGGSLMMTPLTLINSFSISDNNIENYLTSYIHSTLLSFSMGFLYFFLLTKTNLTREKIYYTILSIIIGIIGTFIFLDKWNNKWY